MVLLRVLRWGFGVLGIVLAVRGLGKGVVWTREIRGWAGCSISTVWRDHAQRTCPSSGRGYREDWGTCRVSMDETKGMCG